MVSVPVEARLSVAPTIQDIPSKCRQLHSKHHLSPSDVDSVETCVVPYTENMAVRRRLRRADIEHMDLLTL